LAGKQTIKVRQKKENRKPPSWEKAVSTKKEQGFSQKTSKNNGEGVKKATKRVSVPGPRQKRKQKGDQKHKRPGKSGGGSSKKKR